MKQHGLALQKPVIAGTVSAAPTQIRSLVEEAK